MTTVALTKRGLPRQRAYVENRVSNAMTPRQRIQHHVKTDENVEWDCEPVLAEARP